MMALVAVNLLAVSAILVASGWAHAWLVPHRLSPTVVAGGLFCAWAAAWLPWPRHTALAVSAAIVAGLAVYGLGAGRQTWSWLRLGSSVVIALVIGASVWNSFGEATLWPRMPLEACAIGAWCAMGARDPVIAARDATLVQLCAMAIGKAISKLPDWGSVGVSALVLAWASAWVVAWSLAARHSAPRS